jgi:hypothetical protein
MNEVPPRRLGAWASERSPTRAIDQLWTVLGSGDTIAVRP